MGTLLAQTLTFGLSLTEDRLWVRLSGEERAVVVWLTRRMANGWLNKMPELLQTTCPDGMPGYSLPAEQRVAVEHEVALQGLPPTSEDYAQEVHPQAMAHKPDNLGLITDITMNMTAQVLQLLFTTPSGLVAELKCTRTEAHQILNVLFRQTEQCDWGLEVPAWLRTGGAE